MMSKDVIVRNTKNALPWVEVEVEGFNLVEEPPKMLLVLVSGVTCYEQIVQVEDNKLETTTDFVYEALECLCNLPKVKVHFYVFKNAKLRLSLVYPLTVLVSDGTPSQS